jgi:hypothetical protein
LGRRALLPQRRQRFAFQALRELQFMQIFLTSVLASASGNLAISSPAEREREMRYITLTALGHIVVDYRSSSASSSSNGLFPIWTMRS